MSSGGSPDAPPPVAPTATPVPGREEDEAKRKVLSRAKRHGRESTILAGRLNSEQKNTNILNTRLGG